MAYCKYEGEIAKKEQRQLERENKLMKHYADGSHDEILDDSSISLWWENPDEIHSRRKEVDADLAALNDFRENLKAKYYHSNSGNFADEKGSHLFEMNKAYVQKRSLLDALNLRLGRQHTN